MPLTKRAPVVNFMVLRKMFKTLIKTQLSKSKKEKKRWRNEQNRVRFIHMISHDLIISKTSIVRNDFGMDITNDQQK